MEISEGGFGDQKRIDPIERFGVILFIQRSTVEVVKIYPIIYVWSYAAPVLFRSLNHEQYLDCRPNVHEVFIGSKENPPPKKLLMGNKVHDIVPISLQIVWSLKSVLRCSIEPLCRIMKRRPGCNFSCSCVFFHTSRLRLVVKGKVSMFSPVKLLTMKCLVHSEASIAAHAQSRPLPFK